MPTKEEILALVQQMPELDPAPPPEEKKPPDAKPDATKPQPPKPAEPAKSLRVPGADKGKLTGPTWPDAQKIYDAILAGGKESVSVVIDLINENDIGPAYKPRYVLHGLAVYACREGKEKERAAVIEAILSELTGGKPKTIRGFLVRTLQVCADAAVIPNLAPLLADEALADAAAQAMVSLATMSRETKTGEALQVLRDALAKSSGRPKLAIIQALGALKDGASLAALSEACTDADENIQITAMWSLARTGDAKAIEPILKGTDAPESWSRSQTVKAAFMLAESLAASGNKADAGQIYERLVKTRKADTEGHVRDAAERGLAGLR
jgi:hypothetical protein